VVVGDAVGGAGVGVGVLVDVGWGGNAEAVIVGVGSGAWATAVGAAGGGAVGGVGLQARANRPTIATPMIAAFAPPGWPLHQPSNPLTSLAWLMISMVPKVGATPCGCPVG
jgi:hypothetical protein